MLLVLVLVFSGVMLFRLAQLSHQLVQLLDCSHLATFGSSTSLSDSPCDIRREVGGVAHQLMPLIFSLL